MAEIGKEPMTNAVIDLTIEPEIIDLTSDNEVRFTFCAVLLPHTRKQHSMCDDQYNPWAAQLHLAYKSTTTNQLTATQAPIRCLNCP